MSNVLKSKVERNEKSLSAHMLDSDLLLLIITPEEPYRYTTKLFEYLGTKRPILALVTPQGVAADLTRSTKSGIIVSPKDTNSIKQAILKLLQEWERGDLRTIQSDVSGYVRKVLTGKLFDISEFIASMCDGCYKGDEVCDLVK